MLAKRPEVRLSSGAFSRRRKPWSFEHRFEDGSPLFSVECHFDQPARAEDNSPAIHRWV